MRRLLWAIVLASAASALPAAAADDVYLFDVVKKPFYARVLASLLDERPGLPRWTRNLLDPRGDYVGTPAEYMTIEGDPYELYSACRTHECDANRAVVMFSPKGTRGWAGVFEAGKPITWLGASDAGHQAAMRGGRRHEVRGTPSLPLG